MVFPNILQFFTGLASTFSSFYTSTVQVAMTFLLEQGLPTEKNIHSNFFSINFGGIIGLVQLITSGIVVILLLLFFLSPKRDHSMRWSRLFSSLIGVVLYSILLFRAYGLLDSLSQGIAQFSIDFLTNKKDGNVQEINDLLNFTTPAGVASVVISGSIAVLVLQLVVVVALIIKTVVILLLILYPLIIILRPLGGAAIVIFNGANAFFIVSIVAPMVMSWSLAAPVLLQQIVPGASATGMVGVAALAGALFAFTFPIILFFGVFNTSSRVFGNLDVKGQVAIRSLPPIDVKNAQREVQEVKLHPIRDAMVDVVGDNMRNGAGISGLFEDIPKTAANVGASIALATGHPVASGAINYGYSVIDKHRTPKSPSQANEVTSRSDQEEVS